MTDAPPVVTLGDDEVELVEPPSLFALAAGRTKAQAERGGYAETLAYGAAALRMCWPPKRTWPARPRPREWRPGVPSGEYGAEIWEGLRAATRGRVSVHQLQAMALRALTFAVRSGMTEEEVSQAEDFWRAWGEE